MILHLLARLLVGIWQLLVVIFIVPFVWPNLDN